MFKQVTLYTNVLKPMQRFYQNVMELDIINIRDQQFSVIVGETTLIFIQSEQTAVYHFAINIPGNQFTIMKHWIKDRLTLNREGGKKSTRLNSSHVAISYAVFCLKKKIRYVGKGDGGLMYRGI